MKIKIVNTSKHPLPSYQTSGAAAVDLRAALHEPVVLKPGQRLLVPTGIHLELPIGYEAQLRPRSGLALKHGLSLVNTPATIDSDYRGEIQVIMINHGQDEFVIKDGERICQMVIAPCLQVEWEEVDSINDNTQRGKQGFGHTGR